MEFQYERVTLPGVPNQAFDEFYTYVDIILNMLGRERVNPYTDIPYCPNNDPIFEMLPVQDTVYYAQTDMHRRELSYRFRATFSLPYNHRINGLFIETLPVPLKVELILSFNIKDEFYGNRLLVYISPQITDVGSLTYHMIRHNLHTLEGIRDGLRIFLASIQNFYRCRPDSRSELRRRDNIIANYIQRYRQYIHYMQNDFPRNDVLEQFWGRHGPGGQYHRDMMEGVEEIFAQEHNRLMREVTSQGVAADPE